MSGKKVDSVDLKTPSEVIDITFDYSKRLVTGETIVGATVTATVRKGTDATPSAVLDGAPAPSTPYVIQRVHAGVSGVTYSLQCLATTSTGRVLEIIAIMPVRSLA